MNWKHEWKIFAILGVVFMFLAAQRTEKLVTN